MSLGGVESLVSIPVYSSHVFMDEKELALHGVTPGMIRISVGVEDIDDIIDDFYQALISEVRVFNVTALLSMEEIKSTTMLPVGQ
jgi:cystathionine beta-lyase/cystathionine gamma-synthase